MAKGTTVDAAALVATPQAFSVAFKPTLPAFTTGRLRWTDVSGGSSTVAFMFDFTGDSRFTADGRVQVEESVATFTQDELVSIHWAGEYSLNPVGATQVLLQQYNGVADARFIRGGVMYEVLGPALGPSAALDLATQLVTQLG